MFRFEPVVRANLSQFARFRRFCRNCAAWNQSTVTVLTTRTLNGIGIGVHTYIPAHLGPKSADFMVSEGSGHRLDRGYLFSKCLEYKVFLRAGML